jgi:hypothetical protein
MKLSDIFKEQDEKKKRLKQKEISNDMFRLPTFSNVDITPLKIEDFKSKKPKKSLKIKETKNSKQDKKVKKDTKTIKETKITKTIKETKNGRVITETKTVKEIKR